jgi:hypothetical protein
MLDLTDHKPKQEYHAPKLFLVQASDYVCGCQPTGLVANFDLDSGVSDPEAPMKLVAYLIDEVVSRRTARHNKVTCQGGFRRTHRPYMKIMHVRYAGKHFEILAHGRRFDPAGHGLE